MRLEDALRRRIIQPEYVILGETNVSRELPFFHTTP